MSFKSCALGGLYVLRWGALPEVRDVNVYATEIAEAYASQRTPLVGLFVMPPDSAAPDEIFRKAQAKAARDHEAPGVCCRRLRGAGVHLECQEERARRNSPAGV